MDWNFFLLVSAIAFGVFALWKARPAIGLRPGARKSRAQLRDAKTRVSQAKEPRERALALCDAGDAAALLLGRTTSAVGYYLRAMRALPSSPEIVERAANALSRRPRSLEGLMWRRLGAEPWRGTGELAARAAIDQLRRLYEGPLRSAPRARALAYALAALEGSSSVPAAADAPDAATGPAAKNGAVTHAGG